MPITSTCFLPDIELAAVQFAHLMPHRQKSATMKQEYYQMGQIHGDVISFGSLDDFFRERGNTIDHAGWSLRHLREKFRLMEIEGLYTKYCAQLRKWLLLMLCLVAMAQVGALIGLFIYYSGVSVQT